jgi:hypothetical protein
MRHLGNVMNTPSLITRSLFAAAFVLLAWGCNSSRSGALPFSETTGQHPAAWLQNHPAQFLAQPDQCHSCHGSSTDPAAAGGISKVSCFTCHPNGVDHAQGAGWLASHPAEFLKNPDRCHGCHGSSTNPAAAGGLVGISCFKCHSHGVDHTTNASWLLDHPAAFIQDKARCNGCHGSATDPLLSGGIAKVSCFQCHHPNGPTHRTGWALAGQHGRLGAQAAPKPANPADAMDVAGFASCTACHGTLFAGGVGMSCMTCHTKSPHPSKPWFVDTDPSLPSHDRTDVGNLPVCVNCHAHGANSGIVPKTPAPAGTAPGCYNATLCHG